MLSQHSQMDGSNSSYIQKIIESWDEFTVTWATQPNTTSQNQVSIPATNSGNQDFIDIDVTNIIKDIVADTSNGHGMMLKLESELYYRGLVFASSDHPNSDLHPELKIVYNENLGLNENKSKMINVFPNPTSDKVFISGIQMESKLNIYNSSGMLISTQVIKDNDEAISTINFDYGLYIFQIISDNEVFTKKIICK